MKKLLLILVLIMSASFFPAACGRNETGTQQASTQPATGPSAESVVDGAGQAGILNGKTVACLYRHIPEAAMEKLIENSFKEKYDPGFDFKLVYVDSLNEGLLMLRSRKIDVLQVMSFSATYLGQRNKDLKVYRYDGWIGTTHMLFRSEKQAQYEKVNEAIKSMKGDGTMDRLIAQWITNLPVGEEPGGGAMPVIKGAETVYVGISGDAPPLDYTAADGTPSGYNVAVLSEISRRAHINIALVTVNTGARFTALLSGKIDAFLWHTASEKYNTKRTTYPRTVKIGTYKALITDSYLTANLADILLR